MGPILARIGKKLTDRKNRTLDLVFYGHERQLEFDFVVAPGADPNLIKLAFEGADRIETDADGNLGLFVAGEKFLLHTPRVYQTNEGRRGEVAGAYVVCETGSVNRCWEVGFQVAAYDSAKPLIIDPVLSYSTYLGGSGNDSAAGIAVDAQGSAYVIGTTDSPNFPTANAIDSALSGPFDRDAFVVKLTPDGSGFVYATYLGGESGEEGHGITVDANGNAYVTGATSSRDFPAANAFQPQIALCCLLDAFVTKLNAAGNAILYSTYLGGSDYDRGRSITIDSTGNVYVAGVTSSQNFPTTFGALQPALGGGADAFIAKINPAGSALVYSTYLGGSGDEGSYAGLGVAVDALGNACVEGNTTSTNFPTTPGTFQPVFGGGGSDAFVTKLNASGTAFIFSSYLGGNQAEHGDGDGIAVDAAGNIYVCGATSSTNFPTTPTAFQPRPREGHNAFLTKLKSDGSALVYSTYFGNGTRGTSVAVDSGGNAHLAGSVTAAPNLPLVSPIQSTSGGGDYEVFLATLDPDGSTLLFSTYIGGSDTDWPTSIAVDQSGNTYVAGYTTSTNFPMKNALQSSIGGAPADAFVVKISDPDTIPPVALVASNYGDSNIVTLDFSEPVNLLSATNAANYAFDHGVTVSSVTMGVNSKTVRLLASGLTNGVAYTLTVNGVLDRAPVPNPISPNTHTTFTAMGLYRGFLHQQIYNLADPIGRLADLTNNAKFPDRPDKVADIHQAEIVQGANIRSGVRLSGYLMPPTTGDYTFYLSTFGPGLLYLSRNESPLNKVQIAFDYGGGSRNWNHLTAGFHNDPPPSVSLPIHLEAGEAYFLEALAANDGGDALGVTWQMPGQPPPQKSDPPIAGNYLAILGDPLTTSLNIVQQPKSLAIAEGQLASFTVKATASHPSIYYQWRKNGVEMPGENGPSIVILQTHSSDDRSIYDCVLTVPGGMVTSAAAALVVTKDVKRPTLVSVEGDISLTNITLKFSEPINGSDATNTSNYALSGRLTLSDALLLVDQKAVVLTTSAQTPGTSYSVVVNGIQDQATPANLFAAGARGDFIAWVDEELVGPFPSWANVKRDYGAIGDGVADDTASLQKALEEVTTPGHPSVVFFPPGTYRIISTLNFNSRISASLVGDDPVTTIIKWDGPKNADMMFANSVAYSQWKRLTWDGSGKARVAVHHGFTGGAYQVTGNLHTDEIFKDIGTGLSADPANGGDSHTIIRCHFVRCFDQGIAVGSYNVIDWHVWDSVFEDCTYGLRSFAGNFHVYRSLFLRSAIADTLCSGGGAYYGIRGNVSIGSKTFVEGYAAMTIQGNTVVDSLDPISVRGSGPVILLDNVIRSRADVQNGPVVDVVNNLLSAGNTFTVARPITVVGRSITMDDRVVGRDALVSPLPTVQAFLPKANRPIIEVAAGANAATIQQAIDTAAGMNGSRPIVHLPKADYYLDRTLVIPANCDLQLVGDGFTGHATSLHGTGKAPALRLAGPSHATLRDLSIANGWSDVGVVVENCDQPQARVFMEHVYLTGSSVNNLLVDRLDHTDVNMHDLGHGGAGGVSIRVIGGAAQAAGQLTTGRVDLFGGESGVGNLVYQVEHGGRLMVQDCWFEAGPGFMRLTDSGTFTINNAQISPGDANHLGGGPNGAVELDDFHGQVSFLNTFFTQTSALVKGNGSATELLLLGCNGFPDDTIPKLQTYLDNQSPNATVKNFFAESRVITGPGAYNTYALPDLGDADPVFLRKMLSQVRSETPRRLVPQPSGVSDVRIYRVSVEACKTAMKLTGINTAPQLVSIPTQYVIKEGGTLSLTNLVTDPDLPFDSLTFALAPGAPVSMNLNPTNGVLKWTPLESEGPSTNRIQVIIGDDGSPRFFLTNTITITVLESNLPPTLGIVGIVTNAVLENLVNINSSDSRVSPSWGSLGNGDYNLFAGGYQFYDFDHGAFAYQRISGDFDVRVRLAMMEALRPETSAGLMVRETLDEHSRMVEVLARPAGLTQDGRVGGGAFDTRQRSIAGADDDRWDSGYGGGKVTLPHAWMRLRRQSQKFTAYWSDDGLNWNQIGQHAAKPAYPQEVYVGLGVASGYSDRNAHFEFCNFQNLVTALVPISDATMNERSPLMIEMVASDADLPLQALTFSLEAGAPAGAAILPATGVFTWTPTEAQGPGTYPITVRVTDNGSPPLSATNSFTVTVNEVNAAPVLAAIGNRSVNEGSALNFVVTASDPNDVPPNQMARTASGLPTGATFDAATGVFAWTPDEVQGPGTYQITFTVTDDGVPPLSASETITITVNEVNSPPQLAALTDSVIDEHTQLKFTATASDPDIPPNKLTFSLGASAPNGASIDLASGTFVWTPSEAQGPGKYPVMVRATDDGEPPMSAEQKFVVTVNEVNSAPKLSAISDQSIEVGLELMFAATATDEDVPPNSLTFTLVAGAPERAKITPAGFFTWTPTEAQGGASYPISISVTDDGVPPLSDSKASRSSFLLCNGRFE